MSFKKAKDIMRLAKSLVETHNLTKIRPSTVRRLYVIMRDKEKLSDDELLIVAIITDLRVGMRGRGIRKT